jgi:DNA-directed RNA polymerase III subunit RPC11
VSRTVPSTEYPTGANRLECRTCPYQFIIDKRYYERRTMKRKEVEDVMGGPGAWDNVDQTEGMCLCVCVCVLLFPR